MQCIVKDAAVQIGAAGPGLERAVVGNPVTFVVETKGMPEADLTADVTCKFSQGINTIFENLLRV